MHFRFVPPTNVHLASLQEYSKKSQIGNLKSKIGTIYQITRDERLMLDKGTLFTIGKAFARLYR
jgi:hypothetical protein